MTIQPEHAAPLLRRAELLSLGLSDNRIRKARSKGLLTSIVPGVYLSNSEIDNLEPVARHRAAVCALAPNLAVESVISHLSAAVVHGLIPESISVTTLFPAPVHITRPGPTKSRRGQLVQVHRSRLTPVETVRTAAGPDVTSVPRTVLDCAFTLPFSAAVALAQAALAITAVSPDELATQLNRHSRTPGMLRAAAVLEAVGIAVGTCSASRGSKGGTPAGGGGVGDPAGLPVIGSP